MVENRMILVRPDGRLVTKDDQIVPTAEGHIADDDGFTIFGPDERPISRLSGFPC